MRVPGDGWLEDMAADRIEALQAEVERLRYRVMMSTFGAVTHVDAGPKPKGGWDDVIDRHVKVGQWLSDLPGPVREIRYRDCTLVTIDAAPADVTVKLGIPVESFVGPSGRFLTWEHPEGFRVEVFVPADVS